MTNREQLNGYLAALGTVAIWSGFIIISRLGGKSVLTPYDVLALRLSTAALLLLPFAGSLPKGTWTDRRLWTLVLTGGVFYGLFIYTGFKHAPAAHGAILLPGTMPFLVTVIAVLVLGVKTHRNQRIGLAAIAIGVLCVASPYLRNLNGSQTLFGDACIFAASIVWSVYSVLAKKWSFNPWVLTRVVAIGSAAIYLPIYFLFLPRNISAAPLSTIVVQGLYQGIGATIVAMLFYLKAVSSIGPERTGAVIALVPVIAGLAAAPLLGEPLTPELMAGLVFTSVGAFIAARPTVVRSPVIAAKSSSA